MVKMLAWRVRKLSREEVAQALAAVAAQPNGPFTLTDVIRMLPREVAESRKKRRSIGTLLQNLAELGYLSKPSERKWVKNAPSFSHFLSQSLLELSSLEKSLPQSRGRERRVLGAVERPRRTSR